MIGAMTKSNSTEVVFMVVNRVNFTSMVKKEVTLQVIAHIRMVFANVLRSFGGR